MGSQRVKPENQFLHYCKRCGLDTIWTFLKPQYYKGERIGYMYNCENCHTTRIFTSGKLEVKVE